MVRCTMATTKSFIEANKLELDRKWNEKYPQGRYTYQNLEGIVTLAKEVRREPFKDGVNSKGIVVGDDLAEWTQYHRGNLPPCYVVKNGFLIEKTMNNHWGKMKYFDNKQKFLDYLKKNNVSENQINTFLELDNESV